MSHQLHFSHQSHIDAPFELLYDWHARPGAFERLVPPWLNVDLIARNGLIEEGSELFCRLKYGLLNMRMQFRHRGPTVARSSFCDYQVSGPFKSWEHHHHFLPDDDGGSILTDEVHYELPWSSWSHRFLEPWCERRLRHLFEYRHATVAQDLAWHQQYSQTPLTIAIAGGSGLIGRALIPFLKTGGHNIVELARQHRGGAVFWNPYAGELDTEALEGIDVVINLVGENVATRWTKSTREKITLSRTMATKTICNALLRMRQPPALLLNASAIGFYGDRADEQLTEESGAGRGFLVNVCEQWEAPLHQLRDRGIRAVALRLGAVVTPRGGVLQRMLTPFRCGLGGVIGSGEQWMSWIAIDDVLGAVMHIIATPALNEAVNVVSPNPLKNTLFVKQLAGQLHRPAWMRLPASALRLFFGEMADELLLSSCRAQPALLEKTGFRFSLPQLDQALKHMI